MGILCEFDKHVFTHKKFRIYIPKVSAVASNTEIVLNGFYILMVFTQ